MILPLRVGVVTVARSDFGILLPLLSALRNADDFEPCLYVAGAHGSTDFGKTIHEVFAQEVPVAAAIPAYLKEDTAASGARACGNAVAGFADAWERNAPDLLFITGDRYEMLAAAVVAALFGIPVAHLHGGELSQGSIDDMFRHAITKLSHFHFVATEDAGRRVRQLGEESWRVVVTGAPALDRLQGFQPLTDADLEQAAGCPLSAPIVVAGYHPVTVSTRERETELDHLLAALEDHPGTVIFTYAGADPGGMAINRRVTAWCAEKPLRRVVPHLAAGAYFSLLGKAGAMIGNSSSGIVEAASFELPVINLGRRQKGRRHGPNVLDVPDASQPALEAALRRALDPGFRATLRGLPNPYGDGRAVPRILEVLRRRTPRAQLLEKIFTDSAE